MQIKTFCGEAIAPHIDDLARLRIEVFRAFPYLYDGDLAYERDYLSTYARSAESLFVLAQESDRVVGAATGVPMEDETDAFKRPFAEAGWNPDEIFYFGESVLLPEYRGQGLGVRFFEEREAYARRFGRFRYCAFCAVERPANHPLRPADYVSLNDFWANRGYRHQPQLRTEYRWKDIGEEQESTKPMSFWIRELS
ncbi:GNAT family N-acetyltransferase [Marinobacterium aestuariivivens]|uniref:GNAT family N-acetyltransferase n=1 Tax=Marinobacterium aestuariivivens TaxID=1698799 RepID=A0ABW1ZYT7_9GAMM